MLEAVVFDLDGLLIDSEPLWRQAEIEILRPLGVPLTQEMCRETQGMRVDQAIGHWFERYPWPQRGVGEVEHLVVDRVISLIGESGAAKEGAIELVKFFRLNGVPIGVCSSSWASLIEVALARLGIRDLINVVHSAQEEEYGKPHPACYISTASHLGIKPSHCLALEDSFAGALAAKAAEMKVVAVPEPVLRDHPRWGFCDLILSSLAEFSMSSWENLDGL